MDYENIKLERERLRNNPERFKNERLQSEIRLEELRNDPERLKKEIRLEELRNDPKRLKNERLQSEIRLEELRQANSPQTTEQIQGGRRGRSGRRRLQDLTHEDI